MYVVIKKSKKIKKIMTVKLLKNIIYIQNSDYSQLN